MKEYALTIAGSIALLVCLLTLGPDLAAADPQTGAASPGATAQPAVNPSDWRSYYRQCCDCGDISVESRSGGYEIAILKLDPKTIRDILLRSLPLLAYPISGYSGDEGAYSIDSDWKTKDPSPCPDLVIGSHTFQTRLSIDIVMQDDSASLVTFRPSARKEHPTIFGTQNPQIEEYPAGFAEVYDLILTSVMMEANHPEELDAFKAACAAASKPQSTP